MVRHSEIRGLVQAAGNPRRRPRHGAAPAGRLRQPASRAGRPPGQLRQAWVGQPRPTPCSRHPLRTAGGTLAGRWPGWNGGPDRHVLTLGDPAYPRRLLQTADPPLLLYVQGRCPRCWPRQPVAVVGSRRPTAQGADNARAFGAALSQQGLVVVSGLALGIDAAAHEGALGPAAGPPWPWWAPGWTASTRPPPRPGAPHCRSTVRVVSEYAPGTPPLPENFPLRNRIIAGCRWARWWWKPRCNRAR
jgi:DNA processing protein